MSRLVLKYSAFISDTPFQKEIKRWLYRKWIDRVDYIKLFRYSFFKSEYDFDFHYVHSAINVLSKFRNNNKRIIIYKLYLEKFNDLSNSFHKAKNKFLRLKFEYEIAALSKEFIDVLIESYDE